MLAQLTLSLTLTKNLINQHLLVLLPKAKTLPHDLPHSDLLKTVLTRRNLKVDELTNTPVSANTANGALTLMAWAMLDFSKDPFAIQTQVRKAVQLLLAEFPKALPLWCWAILHNASWLQS